MIDEFDNSFDTDAMSMDSGMEISISDDVINPSLNDAVNSNSFLDDCDVQQLTFEHVGDKVFDTVNNCYVVGDVENDMKFVHQQTAENDCSLMAQAQFVERFTGYSFSPEELKAYAEELGVYDPTKGTNIAGHTALLAKMNIPFSRMGGCSIEQLNETLKAHNDVLLGVNAQEFYKDITLPSDAGHAVAILGYGVDDFNNITGYYFADTNNPDAPIFKTVEEFQSAWHGDIIAIPELSEKYILKDSVDNILGDSKPLRYDVFGNVVDELGRRLYLHQDSFGTKFSIFP